MHRYGFYQTGPLQLVRRSAQIYQHRELLYLNNLRITSILNKQV